MTHLFTDDVLSYDEVYMPTHWNMWESEMTQGFSQMVRNVIATLTNNDIIPRHAQLISEMATARGGLGI